MKSIKSPSFSTTVLYQHSATSSTQSIHSQQGYPPQTIFTMKLTLALLAAAVSASTLRRRGDTWTTDLACFDGSGCQQEDRIGTELITNSSLCQTFSDDCISGMIDITPPKGCQRMFSIRNPSTRIRTADKLGCSNVLL